MICIRLRHPFFGVFIFGRRADVIARSVGFVQCAGATVAFDDSAGRRSIGVHCRGFRESRLLFDLNGGGGVENWRLWGRPAGRRSEESWWTFFSGFGPSGWDGFVADVL